MLLATDGCRSPQALEQLMAFAGDTSAADKVKDKPSVPNSSPASLAGKRDIQVYTSLRCVTA